MLYSNNAEIVRILLDSGADPLQVGLIKLYSILIYILHTNMQKAFRLHNVREAALTATRGHLGI